MGVYNNNKDGTRSTLANTIQVIDAPMEQFVSRGEFSAVTPNDVSADNKLVAENEVTKAVDTMPTASASLVGTIVQYVGTTTANYTNGYFYKCVSDGGTYSWVYISTYDDTEIKQDIADIWKVQGELGSKNLLVYPYHGMINGGKGIDFIDDNGVITINGISSTTMYYFLELGSMPLKKGKYIFSVSNILGNNIYIQMAYNDGIKDNFLVNITRSALSQEFIITDDIISNAQRWWVRIAVLENTQVDNLVVYPMIRYASDTDDTWQPYAPTNKTLSESISAQASIIGVYLPNASTPTSKKVVASVGQTSVTFDASSFMSRYNVTASDLDLDISAKTSSGDIVSYKNVNITGGIVTVTFDALAEQTTFICKCSVIQ